jgi:maltose/moltooligosaccharide transporter
MWVLALIYLFQWYAMFCYWQFVSLSIADSIFHTTPDSNPELYEQAVVWAGKVNGFYNIVTFLSAFLLVWLAKKIGAKYVHILCLLMAGAGLLIFPHISQKELLFVPMIGFGIAWASMMGVPYIIVVGSIPKERYGVYMGIINMMIVIPMILQTTTFGFVYHWLLNSKPTNAIGFAGILLLLAAFATTFIKPSKTNTDNAGVPLATAGH